MNKGKKERKKYRSLTNKEYIPSAGNASIGVKIRNEAWIRLSEKLLTAVPQHLCVKENQKYWRIGRPILEHRSSLSQRNQTRRSRCIYDEYFVNLNDLRTNVLLSEADQREQIPAVLHRLEGWKDRRYSYSLGIRIRQGCCEVQTNLSSKTQKDETTGLRPLPCRSDGPGLARERSSRMHCGKRDSMQRTTIFELQ
jgi:hypothetical protein